MFGQEVEVGLVVIIVCHLTAKDGGNADFAGAKIGLYPSPQKLLETASMQWS